MNQDARLKVTYPHHPKVIKLKRLLGPQAVLSHICLLLYVAQNKPLGVLTGMDEVDIEIAANWDDEPGKLVPALLQLRLLDDVDGTLTIHNWRKHNPYAFHAQDRSDRAKKAAEVRWGKIENNDAKKCSEHTQALPVASVSNAPLPTPDPLTITVPDPDPVNQNKQPAVDNGFSKFWETWPKIVAKAAAEKAFKKLKPSEDTLNEIIRSVEKNITSTDWKKENGKFIPHAATWLNGRRWEDEITITASNHSGFADRDYAEDATPLDDIDWVN